MEKTTMKTIQIDDQDYRAFVALHGDLERFIKKEAARMRPTEGRSEPALSFYDAIAQGGFFENLAEGPTDLSCNPAHLDGFGR